MIFSSTVFLFIFFPLSFGIYYLIGIIPLKKKLSTQNVFLLVISVVFYAWGEPRYIFLLMFSVIVNYILARIIDKKNITLYQRRITLSIAVIYNVLLLVFLKYTGFIISIIQDIVGCNIECANMVSGLKMPIGISFFTFQILSYVIDVYRHDVAAQKNILNVSLYIMLFPQMIAGPIVRYKDVESQIVFRTVCTNDVYDGLKRFMLGFSKKILIANSVAQIADYAYDNIGMSASLMALGAFCYMLQIYFDFSGYSDMAIGMGRMAGFHFNENFICPYHANSVQDFWRRWHISLSSWFRDYIYIPLGGNRNGIKRMYFNQFVVFFTTGLWHGASYNFIVWGLYHGIFLCLEKAAYGDWLKQHVYFSRVYTFIIVYIGWIFFRADNLNDAIRVIVSIMNISNLNWKMMLDVFSYESLTWLIMGCFFAFVWPCICEKRGKKIYELNSIILIIIFSIAVLYMVGTSFNPFIYFRF